MTAINLVRGAEWFAGAPVARTRLSRFAALQADHGKDSVHAFTQTLPARVRDVLLGLMKAYGKLKVLFFRYFSDHLHVPGVVTIPPLPDLVCQAATPA